MANWTTIVMLKDDARLSGIVRHRGPAPRLMPVVLDQPAGGQLKLDPVALAPDRLLVSQAYRPFGTVAACNQDGKDQR
jgi:hypothetical protein